MTNKPPIHSSLPGWPVCEDDEIAAVERVMRSGKLNYWTGTEGVSFEKEFAQHLGSRHAIALANGTVALELALYAIGIGPGDEVIVPSRTFIATASSVVARGARPVCVDVDRDSQTLTVDTIRPHLTSRTKAIIPVHLAGWPCDMQPIMDLARRLDLSVIEDCAQSHGAKYHGKHVGTWGDIGAFSFCQDKILTTGGEGGMLVTDRQDLWKKAWSYKDHGKSYDAVHHQQHPPGFRWLHESFGSNWRMTEMQSAIGRVVLRKLDRWVELRRRNAAIYTEELAGCQAIRIPQPPQHSLHAYYKFYAFVDQSRLAPGWNRDRLIEEITNRGIPCFSGSCSEIYLEKAFPRQWRPAERFATARELGETSLMFLVHPTFLASEIQEAARVIRTTIDQAFQPVRLAA
jgi:dTDP-4-amino-4,6-dideoxygalactose transaminase